MTVRSARREDAARLGEIAEAAGLFPADLLPEMISPAFSGGEDLWLVAEADGDVQGFTFARQEELADRVWNVLAIGVDPDAWGQGLGKTLLSTMETCLSESRMIIIETTQVPEQAVARALYAKAGYREQARLPDFFADGEDKIVMIKRMGSMQ